METEHYPKIYLYKRIVQAKRFMDASYASKIDVRQISNEAFFSRFHFIRLFKEIYGKTPHQYLTQVRMERAMLLFKKEKSVSDVCEAVGFESMSSFSGLFKKYTGMSPSVFLAREQLKMQQIQKSPLSYVSACFVKKMGWAH